MIMGAIHYLRDSLTNLITGVGSSKDPRMAAQYAMTILTKDQLEAAFRSDWIARKIVCAPAEDSTREWREWQASQQQIEKLEAEEKRLDLQRQLKRALIKARLYGGAAIVMGVANQGLSDTPLDPERVKKGDLKYIVSFHQFELNAGQRILDIESPWFGQPEYYTLGNNVQNIDDQKGVSSGVRIHPSRVIQLVGNELLDWNMVSASNIWGDSILQVVDDTLKSTGTVIGGIATMVADAKLDIIHIPSLTAQLSDETLTAKLIRRFTVANQAKSTVNSLLLDEKEQWERVETHFAGLPPLMQEYLTLSAGAASIPLSRLVGMAKGKGLGGTEGGGEVDTRNYYDGISSTQTTELSPTLATLDNVFVASTLGGVDPSIFYEWRPLWQMSDAEKADVALKKSQVMTADVTANLINPDALREARVNQLIEDGTYPGLDKAVEEMGSEPPEPTPEEMQANNDLMNKSNSFGQQTQDSWSDVARAAALAARRNGANTKQKLLISYSTTQDEIASIREEIKNTSDPKEKARLRVQLREAQQELSLMGKTIKKVTDSTVNDAEPRSLYVRRDVLNADEIIRWAKSQGFATTLPADDMHVTVTYSRNKVDWMLMGDDYLYDNDGKLKVVPGGPRLLDKFGLQKDCVVLLFNHWNLKYRHDQMVERGASWDFPEYQPHITISHSVPEDFDLDSVEPYTGPIDLGPEIFEEVNENWRAGVTEDAEK